MATVDNAIYVDGKRAGGPADVENTLEQLRVRGGMAWLGLYRPDAEELHRVAADLGLHELAVEDTLTGHQRAKLDHYGDHTLLVLRPARYRDDVEKVEFGELHVYTGGDFVVTVRHAESPDLARVRQRMEAEPELLAMGPPAVLYAVVDQVVDEYEPVIAGLSNDIDEIEDQLFSGDPHVSRRIYELSREVIALQRATEPLERILSELRRDAVRIADDAGAPSRPRGADRAAWVELDRLLNDVHDHAIRLTERIKSFRELLTNALTLSSTLISQQAAEAGVAQNEQMKKISSWAAILFAPSLVGSIYGMNFHHMPELDLAWGYGGALGLMALLSVGLFVVFKANKWL
ncbi:magnesium and cobalt transport protein CorA [Zafaria sp. Z1313]|uniref:magnesium and cobalt transport protein CorA n=1 Tax=unclassified Zafaria TaxID=2828765 RepID=UPI002E7A7A45|nr:magnesium and cobalt transport protein CorA [Zafaria sp. J156]MEE1621793.1 magnesium and cobalt transport protein CorA [Zafaria sp. J156]